MFNYLQFLRNVCATVKGCLPSNCRGISLIKVSTLIVNRIQSFEADEDKPNLLSDIISDILTIDMSVLMGGNIAVVSVISNSINCFSGNCK